MICSQLLNYLDEIQPLKTNMEANGTRTKIERLVVGAINCIQLLNGIATTLQLLNNDDASIAALVWTRVERQRRIARQQDPMLFQLGTCYLVNGVCSVIFCV